MFTYPRIPLEAAGTAAKGKGSISYKWMENEMRPNVILSVLPSYQLLLGESWDSYSTQGSETTRADFTHLENLLCARDFSALVFQTAAWASRTWRHNWQLWRHQTVKWRLHMSVKLLKPRWPTKPYKEMFQQKPRWRQEAGFALNGDQKYSRPRKEQPQRLSWGHAMYLWMGRGCWGWGRISEG